MAVLIVAFGLFFALGLDDYITFEALREHRHWLTQTVEQHALVAAAVYMLIYATVITFSLPGGAVMTVAGGFLFGAVAGTVYVLIGATTGATLLFLIARSTLGAALHERAGPWLQKLEAGFQENELSYMLVLRLIPLFPFFVVNLVPAFLGVSLRNYFIGTLVGIIPGTAVYATFGAGIGSVFDSGEALTLDGVLTPTMLAALIGLAALSLLPVVYKKVKARQG